MGCSYSVVAHVGKPHKISPISKYSPERENGGEYKFKRSRSVSYDTPDTSRLESRDSDRIIPSGRKTFGPESHILLQSLDELDENSAPFVRSKPIMITSMLKQALLLEHIKSNSIGIKETETSEIIKIRSRGSSHSDSLSFIPGLASVEDVSGKAEFSLDLISMMDMIETPSTPPVERVPMPEIDPNYVHIDTFQTCSCFAIQPDSWYTAPRPFLRVQISAFKWW